MGQARTAAEPHYPFVGYDEFIKLYNSGKIDLCHIADGGSESYSIGLLADMRKSGDDALKRLCLQFSKADDRTKAALRRGLGYKDEAAMQKQLALTNLSDADHTYVSLAVTPSQSEKGPRVFISLKDSPPAESNRYVKMDRHKYNALIADAKTRATAPAP